MSSPRGLDVGGMGAMGIGVVGEVEDDDEVLPSRRFRCCCWGRSEEEGN